MSSSPSARHPQHFYNVLSRLPVGYNCISFFRSLRRSYCHVYIFFCENFVKLSFYLLTFICRSYLYLICQEYVRQKFQQYILCTSYNHTDCFNHCITSSKSGCTDVKNGICSAETGTRSGTIITRRPAAAALRIPLGESSTA